MKEKAHVRFWRRGINKTDATSTFPLTVPIILEQPVIFVLFQDDAKKATEFVEKYGAGNIIFGLDPDSRLAIDLGVFGVPETYIIKDLEVKKKFIGPANLLSILTEVNNISK